MGGQGNKNKTAGEKAKARFERRVEERKVKPRKPTTQKENPKLGKRQA